MPELPGAPAPDAVGQLDRARALRRAGRYAEAREHYRAALVAQPDAAAALAELGELLLQQGDADGASNMLARAAQLDPTNIGVGFNLAVALHQCAKPGEALSEMRRIDALAPQDSRILRLRLAMEQEASDPEAKETARRLAAINPSDTEALRELVLDSDPSHAAEAQQRLLTVCRNRPTDSEGWKALSRYEYNRANYAGAMEILDEGISRTDNAALRLIRALSLPKVSSSREEIQERRHAMDRQLDPLLTGAYNIANIQKSVGTTAFHLPYHGLNDRELQKKIAAAHLAVAPYLSWNAPHCSQRKSANSKIRIGFISAFFKRHAVGRIIGGIISTLNRAQFEVFLIHTPGPRDDFSDRLDAAVSGSITVPPKLTAAREAIAKLELDVLFYTDIGMEPFTYYLAFSRLAHVQAVQPGHPITTGIPTMDVFVSSAAAEPANGQDYYSEDLICLKGALLIGKPAQYKLDRPFDLGFPAGRKIYACPSTLYKFHPDFDRLLKRVLDEDRDATLVFVAHKSSWHEFLYERMARTIPDLPRRVKILPYLKTQEFFSLLKSADAVLDTVRFSGGNTSLDSFAVGTPIVTLEGDTLRSRSTTGMYAQMGLGAYVAKNEDEYVARALRTAHDQSFRDEASSAIGERAGLLFDDPTIREELESHFVALASRT